MASASQAALRFRFPFTCLASYHHAPASAVGAVLPFARSVFSTSGGAISLDVPIALKLALKSTIHKAELQIADMDRHYYADHALTIARHPSETDERMMVRLVAFALNASERLEFCKGLSDADEPDLWRKDLTGAIEAWIEVGQPDERRIAKASARAGEVVVIAYGGRTSDIWWQGVRGKVERLRNVRVWSLSEGVGEALARLAARSMRLQVTVQDGSAWITTADADPVAVEWSFLKAAPE